MAEKHTPARIWACMNGPMVGLFVSGGNTADWPQYVRADIADNLVEALKDVLATCAPLTPIGVRCVEDARAALAAAIRQRGEVDG